MFQEIEKNKYCPAGHSSGNFINESCLLFTKENFVKEFKTWSSGNTDIDKIIQKSQNILLIALKEIKDSRLDMVEFLKVMKAANENEYRIIISYYGISKNPSTQNYTTLLLWIYLMCLERSHQKNLVHCDLHSGNILIDLNFDLFDSDSDLRIDLGLRKLENNLILNSNKNNKIYGSIPYIPPEVLRGNEFTKEGDSYSFGGIMYEIVTAQRPFDDQAHDTYLMIDICNGVRPKVPDFMLNWIPEYDNPSERPTSTDLFYSFWGVMGNTVDNNVTRQLKIADENQKNTSKSQKQEFFELFLHSSKLHPQSCYNGQYIHTLHGLHYLLKDLKSGKSADPNLLLKSNESTISDANNTYDIT
ncbi:hypothetical protein Glove_155g95 [Diversispora epigaea]|uniref:Protein kinase domain-containing protein n=1 Tax=Diversispora epigaea TaxID=1348612 RepID=A0A397J1U6_9GLOM|nr:hypothetical protein Glove_155g95 [Diversispora epigaea]